MKIINRKVPLNDEEKPARHVSYAVHVFEKVPRRHIYKVIRLDYDQDNTEVARAQVGEIRGGELEGNLLFTAYTLNGVPLASHTAVHPLGECFDKRVRGFHIVGQGVNQRMLQRTGKVAGGPGDTFTFVWKITGTTRIVAKDRDAAQRKFDKMTRERMLSDARTRTEFTLESVTNTIRLRPGNRSVAPRERRRWSGGVGRQL